MSSEPRPAEASPVGAGAAANGGGESKEERLPEGLRKLQSTTLMFGFQVTARELSKLHVAGQEEQCLEQLQRLGGVRGLEQKLCTSLREGITGDPKDINERQEAYYPNRFPEPPFTGFWNLWIASFNDPVLIILIIAAVVSLIVGVIEDAEEGWIDGVAIMIAVLIVAFVTAGNDYKKELQFRALRDDSQAMVRVRVIRGGEDVPVPIADVVVGDVMHLETGDKIVADGVFISGSSFKTDEAAITGESDNMPKNAVDKPFLLSGTSVAAGTCNMLVTSVGVRSMQGSIMADTAMEAKETPLQAKLNDMVKLIGYVGTAAAILTFTAMIVSWFANKSNLEEEYPDFEDWLIHAFITAVTIIVVAIPEGLPLAVTISLAYSTRKMLADQNLIRVLAACETMGNATDICSDKTGTLTENQMSVVQAWMGGQAVSFTNSSYKFDGPPTTAPNYTAITDSEIALMLKDHLCVNSTTVVSWDKKDDGTEKGVEKGIVRGSKTEGAGILLVESFGFRYRTIRGAGGEIASAGPSADHSNPDIDEIDAGPSGLTERQLSGAAFAEGVVPIVKQYPFTAERKMMSTLVCLDPTDVNHGPVRLYVTGASEFVLSHSSHILWSTPSEGLEDPASPAAAGDRLVAATPSRRSAIQDGIILNLANQALRTLGVAYRDFASRDELPAEWEDPVAMEEGLVFYGVLGIKDPLRPDVKEAVATCHAAGINVRMVTGDNINTARAIAKECGILTREDDVVIEGPAFRKMTPKEVDAILPRLKVMARSSPRDKNLLVRRLNGVLPKGKDEWEKEHGEQDFTWDTDAVLYRDEDFEAKAEEGPSRAGMMIQDVALPGYLSEWEAARKVGKQFQKAIVGVTGDGTNDAPALKAADVGLSMGLSGTQVAKDASDIVILDDRFSSIVNAVMWGRAVFDNIRKFLQFQLTVNVVALLLTFIAAVSQEDPPLSPVQLLWVNLIMDTMGALALGTEAPTRELLDRKPYTLTSSLVSRVMWRNILFQSAFQLAVTLWLLYDGEERFDIDDAFLLEEGFSIEDDGTGNYLNTLIFNVFVWCQIFNEFNARSIGDDWNVWRGLHKNYIFAGVIVVTIGLQIFIVEVGGDFTSTTGLTLDHWGWSIIIGAGALPVGFLMRFFPVEEDPESFADYYRFEEGETALTIGDDKAPAPAPTPETKLVSAIELPERQ